MSASAVRRLVRTSALLVLAAAAASCNNGSATPSPVLSSETFTGTLQPKGTAFHPFTVKFMSTATQLGVTVNSLAPLSGITIGIGFGIPQNNACSVQISNDVAPLSQALFAPNGVTAGNYCVQIYDVDTLTEPVTYTMTVTHY